MIVIKSRVVKSEYNTRSRLCGEFPFNIRYLGIEVIEHIAVTYITAKWNKFNLFIINDFLLLILMQISIILREIANHTYKKTNKENLHF
mgnify:CR=1 FL=1